MKFYNKKQKTVKNHIFWDHRLSWEENEKRWDEGAKIAEKSHPLKKQRFSSILPITQESSKYLKFKSLKYIVKNDHDNTILKNFFKHPLRYGWRLLISLCKKENFYQDGEFFLYGIKNINEFIDLLKDQNFTLLIGFSYCQKPYECPSARFSDQCIHDPNNSICRQCFIGKCVNVLPPKKVITLFIPTIHYIGKKVFQLLNKNKNLIFMITACEMSLTMFGCLGSMVKIRGIGIKLTGRVCNTIKSFELSEKGIKPGITILSDHTQKRILNILHEHFYNL